MDLPNLFSSAPKKDKLFLGLILTDKSVQGVLWKIANGKIDVIKTSEIIDAKDTDKLVVKADQALQELGELSENLNEVLLGLEASWVNPKGIVDAKKPILKKLTDELSLKPVGFVITTEAVTQFISKENQGLNSILVFYSKNKISISLIEKGTLQKTESVGRSNNPANDFIEALARFKSTHKKELPLSIKLVSINLEKDEIFKQQQALITHDWVKQGYFISTPTLEIIPQEMTIKGVINQGGQAVAKSHGLEVSTETSKKPVVESDSKEFAFNEVNMDKAASTKKEPINTPKVKETKSTKEDDNLTAVPTSFGIPIHSKKLPEIEEEIETPMEQSEPLIKQTPYKPQSKISAWISHHKKFALIGFISGILALILIGFFFIAISGTALITLNLSPKNISKDISIILDPSISESDFESLTLKSELSSKNLFFNQTNETTGVTLVGEKASGKITITNKTDGTKTFTAGSSLTANGIRFTLDDDITIASASVEIKSDEEVKTYGTSEANISSVKIGAEANLDAETSLVIADFSTSSYEARVIEQLTGGSSREIRVVSQEDLDQLMLEVKKKILDIAAVEYKDDSDKAETITFVSTNKLTVTDENYSGEEGDEAKTISLELTADVEAISFENGDIKPLAEYVLQDLIPEGFEIIEKDPSILSDVNEESATSSAILVDANLSTQAIPIIDYDALKRELSSKNLSSAKAILNKKSEIKSFVIELFPRILESVWKKLPNNADKIEFKLQ